MHRGVVITGILDHSDHFGTFANISLKLLTEKTSGITHIRYMKNFNIEIFIVDPSKKLKNCLIQNAEGIDSQSTNLY